MIENQTLEELHQNQATGLELAKQEEEILANEMNVFARFLLDAARERIRNGRTN